ncbi:I78 family peptidase inhibitor [Paracoccus albus]|uniref:I78 family peptidase inhibitor n=1 Tax=Paracoccus albus TaxID=3017784 RepID=UPI0022EFFB71|nr:I78 family peptidase inhibitor [Paracoccus albus]WBU61496.1 I78 family peptidase inhibitor [Paracoccus albus]
MNLTRTSALSASILTALTLAACSVETENDVVIPETEVLASSDDPCGAAAYEQYVGEKSPAISLPAGTNFRHYRTGDPVTMDFSPTRINFEYDRTGTLVEVSCG